MHGLIGAQGRVAAVALYTALGAKPEELQALDEALDRADVPDRLEDVHDQVRAALAILRADVVLKADVRKKPVRGRG